MPSHLISIDDLDDRAVDAILSRAAEHAARGTATARPLVGLLFLTPSMRTRVGFAVAAHRLGGSSVDIDELRVDEKMSASESLADAVRVVAGMVDALVVRVPESVAATLPGVPSPVVNGGDLHEHPTQALIDLAAIELMRGSVTELRIALVGDLRMRAATSLVRLLSRRRVGQLVGVSPSGRESPTGIPRSGSMADLESADVVMMVGLPPGSGSQRLADDERAEFALRPAVMDRLRSDAVVLSPMPVIDEIDAGARADARVRMFDQSDYATYVRMAVLEHVLS